MTFSKIANIIFKCFIGLIRSIQSQPSFSCIILLYLSKRSKSLFLQLCLSKFLFPLMFIKESITIWSNANQRNFYKYYYSPQSSWNPHTHTSKSYDPNVLTSIFANNDALHLLLSIGNICDSQNIVSKKLSKSYQYLISVVHISFLFIFICRHQAFCSS